MSVRSRRCVYCAVPFLPERQTARYCSSACRSGAYRSRRRATDPAKVQLWLTIEQLDILCAALGELPDSDENPGTADLLTRLQSDLADAILV